MKELIRTENDVANERNDMSTSNSDFTTILKGTADAHIRVYTKNNPTLVALNYPPQSVAPSMTQLVSVLFPKIPAAPGNDEDSENEGTTVVDNVTKKFLNTIASGSHGRCKNRKNKNQLEANLVLFLSGLERRG